MHAPDDWTQQAQLALAIGQERNAAAMTAARRRVLLATYCTGKADCKSEAHLSCCLSRE
jgi:hypothetical protein